MDEDKALHSWNPGMFKPNFGISRPFLVLTSPKLFLDTDNRVSLRFEFQVPYKLWTIKFRDTKSSTPITQIVCVLVFEKKSDRKNHVSGIVVMIQLTQNSPICKYIGQKNLRKRKPCYAGTIFVTFLKT